MPFADGACTSYRIVVVVLVVVVGAVDSSTQRASSGCPQILFQETNTARRDGSATTKRESKTHATKPTRPHYKAGCCQFKRLWHIFVRGRFGPCATRQIFVRGQFAPGKDVPGHRAQSPKLRTLVTSSRDIGSRKSEASSSCRVKHNHFEPVEKMRGQSSTMITSDRLSSLTFWLISNPSP